MCILFAMSFGLISMLLFLSLMQSSGGISKFLNTFSINFFLGFFHIVVYIWIFF